MHPHLGARLLAVLLVLGLSPAVLAQQSAPTAGQEAQTPNTADAANCQRALVLYRQLQGGNTAGWTQASMQSLNQALQWCQNNVWLQTQVCPIVVVVPLQL